jgi:hypothetical protein
MGHSVKYCTSSCEVRVAIEPEKAPIALIKPAASNIFEVLELSPKTPTKKPMSEEDCPWAPTKPKVFKKKPLNWADWSDSEDEE